MVTHIYQRLRISALATLTVSLVHVPILFVLVTALRAPGAALAQGLMATIGLITFHFLSRKILILPSRDLARPCIVTLVLLPVNFALGGLSVGLGATFASLGVLLALVWLVDSEVRQYVMAALRSSRRPL